MGIEQIVEKLESDQKHIITYNPPPYIRKKLAQVLREGEFRSLAELLNKALDDWLRDRELKTVYQAERKVK